MKKILGISFFSILLLLSLPTFSEANAASLETDPAQPVSGQNTKLIIRGCGNEYIDSTDGEVPSFKWKCTGSGCRFDKAYGQWDKTARIGYLNHTFDAQTYQVWTDCKGKDLENDSSNYMNSYDVKAVRMDVAQSTVPTPTARPIASSCPLRNAVPIPISVSPTSGSQTTQYTVTVAWSKVGGSDFQEYRNAGITLVAYVDGDENKTAASKKIGPELINTTPTDQTYILSNIVLSPQTNPYQLRIRIDAGAIIGACKGYESSRPSLSVTVTSTSTLKEGDSCRPDAQKDPNNLMFSCPAGTICDVKTTGSTEFICKKCVDNLCVGSGQIQVSTPTPTPPPPPCKDKTIGTSGCASTDTAIGDLATDPEGFVKTVFTFLLSLSGGIAVLIFISAGYKYMTSQGNPEGVKAAQEMIVSAVTGLLFIIFSYVILQVIGSDILRIPGF